VPEIHIAFEILAKRLAKERRLLRLAELKAEVQGQRHRGVVADCYRLMERANKAEAALAEKRDHHFETAYKLHLAEWKIQLQEQSLKGAREDASAANARALRAQDTILAQKKELTGLHCARELADSKIRALKAELEKQRACSNDMHVLQQYLSRQEGQIEVLKRDLDRARRSEKHIAECQEAGQVEPAGATITEAQHLVDNYLASDAARGYRSIPRKELVRQIAGALQRYYEQLARIKNALRVGDLDGARTALGLSREATLPELRGAARRALSKLSGRRFPYECEVQDAKAVLRKALGRQED
jgi:chromosome segregation ATPase